MFFLLIVWSVWFVYMVRLQYNKLFNLTLINVHSNFPFRRGWFPLYPLFDLRNFHQPASWWELWSLSAVLFRYCMIFCSFKVKQFSQHLHSLVMINLIWISTDFPQVQLLLLHDYLSKVLLGLIALSLLSIIRSWSGIIPVCSFDFCHIHQLLQFLLVILLFSHFCYIFLGTGRVYILESLLSTQINRFQSKCYKRKSMSGDCSP